MKSSGLISGLIGLVIFGLLAGLLLPVGLESLTNFTSTDETVETMVSIVLPVMIAVALVIAVVSLAQRKES